MAVTVWVGGRVVRDGEAAVPVTDHGLTVGDGVFETAKVTPAGVFALSRHLRRLRRSAELLGLDCPPEHEVRAAVDETVAAAGPLDLGRLRLTLTGGVGPLGSDRGDGEPRLIVTLGPARPWPERISVITVPWTRNERSAVAGAKTTSYAENVVALARARREGAHEALLANTRGELCEGTGSNVFVVVDGVLATPPLSSGCLAGITRELLCEWAPAEGLEICQDPIPMSVMDRVEDVMLTSSTRDVQHVAELDGRPLARSEVGRAAAELYARRAAARIDP